MADLKLNEPLELINFMAYGENNRYYGTVKKTPPKFEYETVEIKGSGIAGSFNQPVPGQVKSMTTTLNWRAPTEAAVELLALKVHELKLLASAQFIDPRTHELSTQPIEYLLKAQTLALDAGDYEPSVATNENVQSECIYVKYKVNGVDKYEIDKLNYICKINGVDYLEGVRKDLGLS